MKKNKKLALLVPKNWVWDNIFAQDVVAGKLEFKLCCGFSRLLKMRTIQMLSFHPRTEQLWVDCWNENNPDALFFIHEQSTAMTLGHPRTEATMTLGFGFRCFCSAPATETEKGRGRVCARRKKRDAALLTVEIYLICSLGPASLCSRHSGNELLSLQARERRALLLICFI